jgi:hypothetical protein
MKILGVIILILIAVGCATYDAHIVSASNNPKRGVLAVSFNRFGEEKARQYARSMMQRFCEPAPYEVTDIQYGSAVSSTAITNKIPYTNSTYQVANSRIEYTGDPTIYFRCEGSEKSRPIDF